MAYPGERLAFGVRRWALGAGRWALKINYLLGTNRIPTLTNNYVPDIGDAALQTPNAER